MNATSSGANLIGAIFRSIAGSNGGGSRAQSAGSGESGWESTPVLDEIARKLLDDNTSVPNPAPVSRVTESSEICSFTRNGSGNSASASLMDEGPSRFIDQSGEPGTRSPDREPEGNASADLVDSSNHGGSDPTARRAEPAASNGRAEERGFVLTDPINSPFSMDFPSGQDGVDNWSTRNRGVSGLAASSIPVQVDGVQNPRAARFGPIADGSHPTSIADRQGIP